MFFTKQPSLQKNDFLQNLKTQIVKKKKIKTQIAPKKSNCWKTKSFNCDKSNFDKTQKLNLWQPKLWEKTSKLKLCQRSKNQIVDKGKTKTLNCDNSNSNCDKKIRKLDFEKT